MNVSPETDMALDTTDTPNENGQPDEGPGGNGSASFADLLDSYDYEKPERGQMLQGVILRAREDEVIVDVGDKRDAIVPSKDLERLEQDVIEGLTPGKEVTVYVMRPLSDNGNLIVSINKALEHEDWLRAEALMQDGNSTQCEVVATNKGGLLVQFGRLRAFVPQSHVLSVPRGASDDTRTEAKEDLVGETLTLKVIDIDRRRDRLVLSERAARREARKARMEDLEVGQTVEGRVVNITTYGAFVDIGGVDGLVHISELDWQRVNHPSEVLSVGDELEVLVKEVDLERERISLSRKELLPNPWDHVEQDLKVGDVITGEVKNVVDFGAFVALPNGLEGLVHVSEMSTYGVSQPHDLVQPGDDVPVKVLDIDPEKERISLSLDAVSSEQQLEWMAARHESEEEETDDAGDDPEMSLETETDAISEADVEPEEEGIDEAGDGPEMSLETETDAASEADVEPEEEETDEAGDGPEMALETETDAASEADVEPEEEGIDEAGDGPEMALETETDAASEADVEPEDDESAGEEPEERQETDAENVVTSEDADEDSEENQAG